MRKFWFLKIAFFGVLAIAGATAVLMWLWNWLIPELFHGPILSFWQALGLMAITRILFRGFAGPRHGCHRDKWMRRCKDFKNLSPEERDRMKDLWKRRCQSFQHCDDRSPVEKSTE